MKTLKTLAAALALTACAVGPVHAATASNGISLNGITFNGITFNGMKMNGFTVNGQAVTGAASAFKGLHPVAVTLPGESSEHATSQAPSIRTCTKNTAECSDPNGPSLDGFAGTVSQAPSIWNCIVKNGCDGAPL